jgi:hypothetical protein
MTYETVEIVELGKAEVVIEVGLEKDPEEDFNGKFTTAVAPYVEYDE